jgi:hypothetical protein
MIFSLYVTHTFIRFSIHTKTFPHIFSLHAIYTSVISTHTHLYIQHIYIRTCNTPRESRTSTFDVSQRYILQVNLTLFLYVLHTHISQYDFFTYFDGFNSKYIFFFIHITSFLYHLMDSTITSFFFSFLRAMVLPARYSSVRIWNYCQVDYNDQLNI